MGFLGLLLIFAVAILPLLFNVFDHQVKSTKLLALSNEVQQLVSSEGDINSRVDEVVNDLQERGIDIEFTDKQNNPITNNLEVGEEVVIHYKFEDFELQNSAIINKR